MATVDASYVTRVEGANAALRHANSRLARERVGVGQAPAARALSHAVNERVAELEGQLLAADARRGEADGALDELRSRFQELETWAREIERQLLEVHATNVWRLGQRYWQVKQRLRLGRRD